MGVRRIKWLDFAKGATIFLVVLYHAILTSANTQLETYLYKALIVFIMPVFFSISGYLYRPINNLREYILMIYKKFISLIIPGLIFTFLGIASENYYKVGIAVENGYKFFICQYGDIWFLDTLFIYFVIAGLMDLLNFPLYLKVIVSFILLLFSLIQFPIQNYILQIGNNMYTHGDTIKNAELYLVYFYLGYIFKKFNFVYYLKRKFADIIIPIFWIVLVTPIYLMFPHISMDMHPILFFVIRIISIFALFSIFINFNQHNYIFKYFTKYGKYTLVIYLVHWPLVYYVIPHIFHIFIKNPINSYLMISVKFVLAWLLSIIVCYLIKKINIINFVFYPRKYFNKLLMQFNWGRKFLKITN